MKLKRFKNARIIILILSLLLSLYFINPTLSEEGVSIRNVDVNSSIANAGLSIRPNIEPRNRERIISIDNQPVNNLEDFSRLASELEEDEIVRIQTNINEYAFLNQGPLGITVEEAAGSNIRKGLDLQGGTRVLLKPTDKISENQFQDILTILENRLNVYGLSDLTVREAKDLFGNKFIVLEIAGVSRSEVQDIIASQGKFEARIGNETVFNGGEKDIIFVCRDDGTCSGIRQCGQATHGYQCVFDFSIKLSPAAAKRHAEITRTLGINESITGQSYLDKPLELFLDDIFIDRLLIGSSLKGRETTDISISGPGIGATEQEALDDAINNMNKLQTALITGSLPTKLDVIKADSISPVLGKKFVENAILTGLLAIIAVGIVIFIRYKKLKIAIPMMLVGASEVFIILGIAAIVKYNLDLAAIAGIIAAVGTGVDDQIVIADEVLTGSSYNWKERTKRAFFIIMTAYATTVAAMIPLLRAGAGLLTGFAFATIVGVSIGVFITRPAFAAILQALLGEE